MIALLDIAHCPVAIVQCAWKPLHAVFQPSSSRLCACVPVLSSSGTIIEVNVSELGLVTPAGKVVWGKYAQVGSRLFTHTRTVLAAKMCLACVARVCEGDSNDSAGKSRQLLSSSLAAPRCGCACWPVVGLAGASCAVLGGFMA